MAFVLPGGRLAAEDWRRGVRLAGGAAWYLGPWARRISGASDDSAKLHRLERRWCARVRRFLRLDISVSGLDHVVPERRYVVLPLHEGFADALALMELGLDLRFVARDELFEWPTLGRYLRNTGQILIEAGAVRTSYRRLLTAGRAAVESGESLVIFPQGSILGIEVAFWAGAFDVAEKLEAWILPVVLTGSHLVWEYPYSPLVRFGQQMSMKVLPPIPPDEAAARAADLESEMKRIALAPGMAPARRFLPEVDGFWDEYSYEIDPSFPELAAVVARHREQRAG